jgi:hypothetical protein
MKTHTMKSFINSSFVLILISFLSCEGQNSVRKDTMYKEKDKNDVEVTHIKNANPNYGDLIIYPSPKEKQEEKIIIKKKTKEEIEEDNRIQTSNSIQKHKHLGQVTSAERRKKEIERKRKKYGEHYQDTLFELEKPYYSYRFYSKKQIQALKKRDIDEFKKSRTCKH